MFYLSRYDTVPIGLILRRAVSHIVWSASAQAQEGSKEVEKNIGQAKDTVSDFFLRKLLWTRLRHL